jgi:hypothetical protein
MAMNTQRLADAMTDLILADPENKYVLGVVQPAASAELDNLCYYLARAIIEEIQNHAETDPSGEAIL